VTRALALGLLLLLAFPAYAAAADPPTEPVLMIEAGVHTAVVRRIAVDAAGHYLVSASDDKSARIWDLKSGRLVRVLRPPVGARAGGEGKIFSVAIAPDGSSIAIGGVLGYDWDKKYAIYVFDRASGQMVRRIAGLPATVLHLAWSPDGRWIAAALNRGGVRLFRAQDGSEAGTDTAYGERVFNADFDRSDRLATTSLDGFVRLYRVTATGLTLIHKQPTTGGRPGAARFSPDGTKLAVGYADAGRVDVLAADTLAALYSTPEVKNATFAAVAWSADGRVLYAGGNHRNGTTRLVRAWADGGKGAFNDLPAGTNTITDLVALRTGGVAYGAFDPKIGAFDAAGTAIFEKAAVDADLRSTRAFRVSHDGVIVQFAFESGKAPATFDLAGREILAGRAPEGKLAPAVTSAPGLEIKDWATLTPALNGQPIKLGTLERSRAVAIAPDHQSFVLGTDNRLARYDRQGKEMWRLPIPTIAWAVNVSGDGRVALAAYADGTIRWYRLADGKELLALFPHIDRKRWVLWSPSGYYDAAAGAEDLIGWHVNRAKDQAADFYPGSRFRSTFYRPDVVAKVLEAQDETAGLTAANTRAGRKTETVEITRSLPPVIEIVTPADGAAVSTPDLKVAFRVRASGDAPVTGVRARVNGQAVTPRAGATAGETREVLIAMPPQDSEILLFAENKHGVSAPATLQVKWKGAGGAAKADEFVGKPKLYVLAVGVSAYGDKELALRYAAKDAQDFARAMLAQKGALYRDVVAKVLTDAQATRDEVVDGLDWLQREVTAKDVGMLFLAGHGVTDQNGIYYYLPVNADLEKLKRTGVPYSDIKNTMASLAGKALFFVDTCHAGNVMGGRRAAQPDITAVVNELASAENGAVVFASSTGRQYSLERPDWNNGAFTKALVERLTGKADQRGTGRITHKMLDYYVAERVKELTGGKQSPVSQSPEGVPDFPIALVVR
jgi:WD40 repeat protein